MNSPINSADSLTTALRQFIVQQSPALPPAPPPTERLLRAATVAARLGCSKAHVYDLWESGKLPCVVLPSATAPTGRAKRIRESDLDAWISNLTPTTPPPLQVVQQRSPRRRGGRSASLQY